MPENPTLGEVMRRLDEITKRFEDTVRDVREFRAWAERLYVPRGEWVEGRRADQAVVRSVADDVKELRSDADDNRKWRRQSVLLVLIAVFSAVTASSTTVVVTLLGR